MGHVTITPFGDDLSPVSWKLLRPTCVSTIKYEHMKGNTNAETEVVWRVRGHPRSSAT